MTPEEEQAASDERVSEAGLDAERIYRDLLEDEEEGIAFVRAVLKLNAQAKENTNASKRAGLTP